MWLAPVLFLHHWLATLLYSAVFFLYYERIIFTEEEFLAKKFGDAYQNWSAKTPLLFPLRWRWVKPELPFSWKTVLRREYHGLLELIVSMTAVEFITDFIVQQRVVFDLFWIVLCTAGVVFYLTIRAAAKWTTLLIVEGRS
ncbi:MAG: hypothetical protein LBN39_08595, partial [Planctomycetaceae bacterium]|jgi:hypothetical protein|nr:hypothetical protein [Planctomycetaceae bacterium]